MDNRLIDKYVELLNLPDDITKILKYFTGEIKPAKQGLKDPRRTLLSEMNESDKNKIIDFFEHHSEVDAATCNLILALTGKTQPECHRGFPTPWNAFCHFFGLGLPKLFPHSKSVIGPGLLTQQSTCPSFTKRIN